ncbi:aminoglycoside phosphotransferase family protein [Pseudoalteromonas distincta]|uniref:aminoglycoside phosphotransferase family protein n=1 Tax=Pseudoalteromonas distincta TaxID=77608 RepID=UPI0032E1FA2D
MKRFENLQQFINTHFNEQPTSLNVVTGDASFRRYYRLNSRGEHFIVMDSDPNKVNNAPYISLNKVFTEQGFLLPKIIVSDELQGFFILSDLGSTHLADMLGDINRTEHYKELINLSVQWAKTPASDAMQAYNEDFIKLELDIFSQWLVTGFINESLSADQKIMWQTSSELLIEAMLAQPTVTVHRDYHSRNIMNSNGQWAIIDYQDAVRGPLCYDLVSLLRDCYFKLPDAELTSLLGFAYKEFTDQDLIIDTSFNEFKYYFDLTGLQRHLKAAGIFCRLYLRDGKAGYLDNILPTLNYIIEVAANYSELTALSEWIKNIIVPKVIDKLAKEHA